MAELIRVEGKHSQIFPSMINTVALSLAGASLAISLANWQAGDKLKARYAAVVSTVCGVIVDTTNRLSKSEVAIATLAADAEARLTARLIQAQETTQTADLSVASGKQLAELNLGKAHVDAETAIHLAELEMEYQNAIARLQEFVQTDE